MVMDDEVLVVAASIVGLGSGRGDMGADVAVLGSDIVDLGIVESGVVDSGVVDSGVVDSDMVGSHIVDHDTMDFGLMCFGVVDWDMVDFAVVRSSGSDLLYCGTAAAGLATADDAWVPQVIVRFPIMDMAVAGMTTAAHAIGWSASVDDDPTDSATIPLAGLGVPESAHSMHYRLEDRRAR
jgi:hypothetical protein